MQIDDFVSVFGWTIILKWHLSSFVQPPKDSKQKKDTSKAKKDKDPVNKSGGKAKKKVPVLCQCLFLSVIETKVLKMGVIMASVGTSLKKALK